MQQDRYGNALETTDAQVAELYDQAMDALLAGDGDMRDRFEAVVQAAPEMTLGHTGLARTRQIWGDMAGAMEATAKASALAKDGTREACHVAVMDHLLSGRGPDAYAMIREHVRETPRDAMLAQMCTSVFGMIGFSGRPGREAELLAYTESLMPHYGDDWWMLSQHAFSLCETGQTDRADKAIDRALELNPRSAHSAHVRSHTWYEAGQKDAGLAFLRDWMNDADPYGLMHGHLSWHVALWSLAEGDFDTLWSIYDAAVVPDANHGLPINVLTDAASMLFRVELSGEDVSAERWKAISAYARRFFPGGGLAFVDVHAALAHAMAGDGEALQEIIAKAAGPAADLTRSFSQAFDAITRNAWEEAAALLTIAMADDARIGGSRAQRDVLEFTFLTVLLKLGRMEEAQRLIALRRPHLGPNIPVAGFDATRMH